MLPTTTTDIMVKDLFARKPIAFRGKGKREVGGGW
jgi:hypothetical protein